MTTPLAIHSSIRHIAQGSHAHERRRVGFHFADCRIPIPPSNHWSDIILAGNAVTHGMRLAVVDPFHPKYAHIGSKWINAAAVTYSAVISTHCTILKHHQSLPVSRHTNRSDKSVKFHLSTAWKLHVHKTEKDGGWKELSSRSSMALHAALSLQVGYLADGSAAMYFS